jgi:hypothetical protein
MVFAAENFPPNDPQFGWNGRYKGKIMAKIDALTIADWLVRADNYCRDKPYKRGDIKSGADAWILANRCDMTRDAYKDPEIVDAHIVTALKVVFPNAVFKDKYHY